MKETYRYPPNRVTTIVKTPFKKKSLSMGYSCWLSLKYQLHTSRSKITTFRITVGAFPLLKFLFESTQNVMKYSEFRFSKIEFHSE